MEDERAFYKIPHYLDQGKLIMGMPWVEVIPTLGFCRKVIPIYG